MTLQPILFTIAALPYLLIGILIKGLIIWLFLRKKQVSFLNALLAALLATSFVAFIGLFVVVYKSFVDTIIWLFVMLIVSFILETAFYYAYFTNKEISRPILKLSLISIIGNLITFLIIFYGLLVNTTLTKLTIELLGF